jgi:cell wall-associated NlpC family hydrolase
MQSTMGVYVPRDQLQPGDLVFYYSPVSHVGIYIGNNQLIEAPNTGSVVSIRDLDAWGGYSHAQRVALP